MTRKKSFLDSGIKCCLTCMYINQYEYNVMDKGKEPHGWDGTCLCGICDEEKEETNMNRIEVSPLWKACPKYKECTERQANYLDIYDSDTKSIIPNPHDISRIEEI